MAAARGNETGARPACTIKVDARQLIVRHFWHFSGAVHCSYALLLVSATTQWRVLCDLECRL